MRMAVLVFSAGSFAAIGCAAPRKPLSNAELRQIVAREGDTACKSWILRTMRPVESRGFCGRVRTDSGEALPGARVTMFTPDGRLVAREVTGVDGGFCESAVDPGRYVIVACREGFDAIVRELRIRRGARDVEVQIGLAFSS